ncbi:MAG: tetratricopeptide repeat protein [Bdellovibrionota bacterium]
MDKASLFAAADKASEKGQTKKAVEYLESILKADPNDLKALNKVTDLYVKLNDIEKTIDYLSRIAILYTKDGFYTRAIAIYKRILKVNTSAPNSDLVHIHEQLADLYAQLGLVSDAMNHFRLVIEFHDRVGNRPALLTVLEKVAELDPENIESQLKLTDFFAEEGRDDSLQQTFQRLVEACESTGNISGLISIYEKWLEFKEKDEGLQRKLVDLYVQAGEPKKALARLQKSFRKDPYHAETLELLSEVFVAMKQPEKARVVDIERLKLYRKNGQEERALELEEKLKAPDPFNTERAKKPIEEDNPIPEALSLEESLIAGSASDPEEKKIISECDVYAKYGLLDKAREVLTVSLESFPKSLGMRWKLAQVCKELDLVSERNHQLLEIQKIAKAQSENDWLSLVEAELGPEAHVPTATPEASTSSELVAPSFSAANEDSSKISEHSASGSEIENFESSVIQDFSDSEISIVVDDFSKEEASAEIAFSAESIVEASDDSHDVSEAPLDLSGEISFVVEEEVEEKMDFAPVMIDESPVMIDEVEEKQIEDESVRLESSASSDEFEPADLLSENDFSPEELQAFDDQLAPTSSPKIEPVPEAVSEIELSSDADSSEEVLVDADFEIRQMREEIEFFRSEGLIQEAEELELSFKKKFPDWKPPSAERPADSAIMKANPSESSLKHKAVDVDVLGSKMKMMVQEDEREASEDEFFDLVSELNEEFDSPPEEKKSPGEISEVFSAFKKGIDETIAKDDFQTHFDLGIAYREMGLVEDALDEFLLCSKLPGKRVVSLYQAGLCEVARENYQQAVQYFDDALKEPELDDQEKISLSYELAELFLRQEQKSKAAALFQEIQKIDPEFREVQKRLEQCR